MAAFNKFDSFVEALAEKNHDLGTDVIKAMLINVAPIAVNSVKTDLTEIAAGNGYVAGGMTIDVTASSQTAGTYTLVADDEVLTAAGGSIGPFRYVALYNDTATSDELIGWYDYLSSISVNDGETFTIDFGASVLSLA
jgi:hypothetical protein